MGGFDSLSGTLRSHFMTDKMELPLRKGDKAYGAKFQENENSSQVSLFGEVVMFKLLNRSYHSVRTGALWKLAKEKEVVGIYISGHPLDDYKFEMKYFVMLNSKHWEVQHHVGKNLTFGIINDVQHRIAKKRKRLGNIYLGYDESYEFKSLEKNTLSSIILFKTILPIWKYWSKRVGSIRILVKKRTKDTVYISTIFTGRVGWFCKEADRIT
jgi:DNA polymerase III alpha subunit